MQLEVAGGKSVHLVVMGVQAPGRKKLPGNRIKDMRSLEQVNGGIHEIHAALAAGHPGMTYRETLKELYLKRDELTGGTSASFPPYQA